MKAVVLVVEDDEAAPAVARLIAAALMLNGFSPGEPSVIDWPLDARPRTVVDADAWPVP